MGDNEDEARALSAVMFQVALRPGMWGLDDDFGQASAFVTGCQLARPDVFVSLGHWSIARLRGARDNTGWSGALAILSRCEAATAATTGQTPLLSALLRLVGQYLLDMSEPGGQTRIELAYMAAREQYDEAHRAFHDGNKPGVTPWDPAWHTGCAEWERQYVPEIGRAIDLAASAAAGREDQPRH